VEVLSAVVVSRSSASGWQKKRMGLDGRDSAPAREGKENKRRIAWGVECVFLRLWSRAGRLTSVAVEKGVI
jgi:hypothetical protein